MKFKAKLTPQQTNLLYNLIHPISRLHPSSSSSSYSYSSPSTILYLDDDKLVLSTRGGSFSTSSSNSNNNNSSNSNNNNNNNSRSSNHTNSTFTQSNNDAEGIFCFAELVTKNGIFREHIIQSVETDNAILMEINITQLKTALRGVLNAQNKYTKDKSNGGGGGGMGGIGGIGGIGMGGANSGMTSAFGGPELTIKLAKRNGGLPHLCLDVKEQKTSSQEIASLSVPQATLQQQQQIQQSSSTTIGVHHAIPVRMMRVEELQHHVPPRLGMPDVQLELPRDRPLKNVVERLRMISPHVFLEGSMKGLLSLRIDGDGASIRTTFTKLIPIHEDCKSSQQSQSQQPQTPTQNTPTQNTQMTQQDQQHVCCTVKVDSKKLYASLHWQGTLHMGRDISTAVLCMWENEMLVLDVTLNPDIGRFMYYVPVHYLSNDWA